MLLKCQSISLWKQSVLSTSENNGKKKGEGVSYIYIYVCMYNFLKIMECILIFNL